MMMSTVKKVAGSAEFRWDRIGFGLLAAGALAMAACDECKNTSDCGIGEICVSGECQKNDSPFGTPDDDTESSDTHDTQQGGSDTDSGSADTGSSSTTPDTQTSDTQGTADTVDTETGSSDPKRDNGQTCDFGDQCLSGHCGDGFCCADGECCAAEADCDSPCASSASCGDDSRCAYVFLPCSAEDSEGCGVGQRCDGFGSCVQVTACADGPYIATGGYSCEPGVVAEKCLGQCFQPTDCNAGYECVSGECVPGSAGLKNGAACSEDTQCSSGHCGDGFCCAEGECCAQKSDCDTSECTLSSCNGNSQCSYSFVPCGIPDPDPGDCAGGSLCDGAGNCVAPTACGGAYAGDGTYTCSSGQVAEDCRTQCSTDDHCNEGYTCATGGTCVEQLKNGETGCESNSACESGNCTKATGVCCESGWCCTSDGDCNGYDCDEGTFSCSVACDAGGADNDAICLETHHCDGGQCLQDIANGGGTCNEASDCASGYCDTSTGICCPGGDCCATDAHCDGASCGADGTCTSDCSPSGTEDDNLCAEGYHCAGSSCVADIPNGGRGCTDDGDCVFGNCSESSGVCCSAGEGECCAVAADCDDENPCNEDYCSSEHHCYVVDRVDGSSCDDGDFCNGNEKCQGGQCVADGDECTEWTTQCLDWTCNEEENDCDPATRNEGDDCSEVQFCLGDVAKTCQSGFCKAPADAVSPCDEEGICAYEECNEESDACEPQTAGNGWPCEDGDPCNGYNSCQDGVCADGANPCDNPDNECLTRTCTNEGGVPACEGVDFYEKGDYTPCAGDACFGTDAYCLQGSCHYGEDRHCNDGNICTKEACFLVDAEGQCNPYDQDLVLSVACGESFDLYDYDFAWRGEYYDYPAPCDGRSYPGAETVVEVSGAGDITVSLSDSTLGVLYLTDHCDPQTCQAEGSSGSLTVNVASGDHTFVIEAPEIGAPELITVTVTCSM